MKALELGLAIASGICGFIAALYGVYGNAQRAATIGGLGLVLCDALWVIRIMQ
jgi:hypothetical protein